MKFTNILYILCWIDDTISLYLANLYLFLLFLSLTDILNIIIDENTAECPALWSGMNAVFVGQPFRVAFVRLKPCPTDMQDSLNRTVLIRSLDSSNERLSI